MSFTVIAGPCVIEDEGLVLEIAEELKKQLGNLPIDFYFKASFDKANRSSSSSFRGPGLDKGLSILKRVKDKTGLKLLTDFHEPHQADKVAELVDYIQVPAFLCRQTDVIEAAVSASEKYNSKLNIKKGQFLAPWDVHHIVEKVKSFSSQPHKVSEWFTVTERGVSFGYNRLIVDMTSFKEIKKTGIRSVYDATHSVQKPGAGADGKSTGGSRESIEVLSRAAMAAGAEGLFFECHPQPDKAKSDAENALYLDLAGSFVKQMLEIKALTEKLPELLPEERK